MDIVTQLKQSMTTQLTGSVVRTSGTTISAAGFPAPIGAVAEIERSGTTPLQGEVIGFHDNLTLIYPYADAEGVRRGQRVRLVRTSHWLRVGDSMLGRVVDAQGRPIDGRPLGMLDQRVPLERRPPAACSRPRIEKPLSTGVRSIDGLLTCGEGQRLGIFAGSGVGKSTLLGMMARYAKADVIVLGLIGERGREVNEFIQKDLTEAGLKKSVVVVATSDEPPLMRVRAASTATAVAEHFRDQGLNVLLLIDSLTRFALAQREIGLAAGEPPATRGYPPSVFSTMPRLIERAGLSETGGITAFYTVLVEGDDPNEPISDCARGLLDGHVWLDRSLAHRGHYPAVDILQSISRLASDVCDPEHLEAARRIRHWLALYKENEDLITIGAYRPGADASLDEAVRRKNMIDSYLRQKADEQSNVSNAREGLFRLAAPNRNPRT